MNPVRGAIRYNRSLVFPAAVGVLLDQPVWPTAPGLLSRKRPYGAAARHRKRRSIQYQLQHNHMLICYVSTR